MEPDVIDVKTHHQSKEVASKKKMFTFTLRDQNITVDTMEKAKQAITVISTLKHFMKIW